MKARSLGWTVRGDHFFAGMVTLGLFFLTKFPDPSYIEVWVDGGPLVAARTVKILVTICVLLLAIFGLGTSVTTNHRSILKETNLSSLVAVVVSGFSLLVIVGSFVSLVPNIGLVLLALVIYTFAVVGLTCLIQWGRICKPKVIRRLVIAGKLDLVLLGLVSTFSLSVIIHSLVLETYSDVLQIYLPFFEYFDFAGSSQAILKKPAFSSFLQLRGLGTHLSATSIGSWTSAQAGSLLALILIAIVVFWGVSDYTRRIFRTKALDSSWALAGGGLLAVLFFYSSAEIYSKPHLVSFSLLLALAATLPVAFDSSAPECLRFERTSIIASIAVCVVYPLNFLAVVLILFVNATIFWIFKKALPIGQIVRNLSWAALSTAVVYVTNLYFVGVFGTEPIIRSIKVGHLFSKFSSESIWQALYETQNLSSFRRFLNEPFASKGLFSKDSIFALINLFVTNGYVVFVLGVFGVVILVWFRIRAAILSLVGGLTVSIALGWVFYKNFDDSSRDVAVLLSISGLFFLIERFANAELSRQKLAVLFKDLILYSPFFAIMFTLFLVALANVVINHPSFNRLALQGNLGVVLLPCALVFFLVKFSSSLTRPDKRREISIKGLKVASIRSSAFRIFFTTSTVVVAIAILQLVFPQRKQTLLLAVVFIPLILNLTVLNVWQANPIRNPNLNERIKSFSTIWIAALIFFVAVGTLPSYPRPTRWTAFDWGRQIAFDFRRLTGATGHMPDFSEVLGFHTKKDIRRCLELESIVPDGASIFPINGLQEFAMCQGTPGLNRGQLIHHYDSVLAPRFDEIFLSDIQQTLTILQEMNINYLVLLKGDCKRFLISQNVAFDANNLSNFRVFGKGSDFVILDVKFPNQISQTSFGDFLPEYLAEYSRSCQLEPIP